MADKSEPERADNIGGYEVPAPSGGPDGELRELKHSRGAAVARGESPEEYDDEVARVLDENDRGERSARELREQVERAAEERREAAEKRRAEGDSSVRTRSPQGRTATPAKSTTDASTSTTKTDAKSTSDKGK